jgi:hypothetical protein
MSLTPRNEYADTNIPGAFTTGPQVITGVKTFSSGLVGPGTIPIGAIIAVLKDSPITSGGYSIPSSGTVDNNGFMLSDGAAIPSGNSLTGSTPNLSDGRYLRGATSSGTFAGSNTSTIASTNLPTHTHAVGTLANAAEAVHTHAVGTYVNAAEAVHTHAVGTYANAAEAVHTHAVGTYGNTAEAAHTHSWGSFWNNDNSTSVTSDNGDGSGNTYSDAGNGVFGGSYWGGGTYIAVGSGTQSANHTHSAWKQGLYLPSSGSVWELLSSISVNQGTNTLPGTESTNHSHNYYLPSHRHWMKSRATTGGSSHNHTFSGTSAAGASHNHTISGSSAAGASHNHTISGSSAAGASHNHTISGSTADGGFTNTALSNEPQYMTVRYLIRVN